MTEWLIARFVKNAENTADPAVRVRYGTFSSMTGIACNILLFLLKGGIGLFSGSIAVVSDAFNNLSDCLSCLISLFGYRMAAKPADKEHPFGHGRSEYVASLFISLIIFLAGFELLITGVSRIIHPSPVRFSWIMVIILIFSILVKLWMSMFYMNIGRRIDSSTLIASAQDSRNDVLSTALTLGAMLVSLSGISFPLDGIAGCVISLLILKAGYDIAKEIITQLLGRPLDPQLSKAIREQILSHPEILGVHDLIIHDYGPGVQIGSAHAEVDADMTLIKAHEIIDAAEEEINEKFHVNITLHIDPVETHNETMAIYKAAFEEVLNHLDPNLSLHDFRLRKKGDCEEASFDILIPYDCALTQDQINAQLKEVSEAIGIQISVIYDHDYTGEA